MPELFKGKQPEYATGEQFQKLVYHLYVQIEYLDKRIGQLIQVLDLLLLDPDNIHQAGEQLFPVLCMIDHVLFNLGSDLEKLKPGLEIHANEIATHIGSIWDIEAHSLGEIRAVTEKFMPNKEELKRFKPQLLEIRGMAVQAKEALAEFARNRYATGSVPHL